MNNNSVIQIWGDFQENVSNAPDTYEAWAFGDSKEMADELADLVAAGVKTATSSNYLLYDLICQNKRDNILLSNLSPT